MAVQFAGEDQDVRSGDSRSVGMAMDVHSFPCLIQGAGQPANHHCC